MKSSGLIQHLSKLITLEVETILVPVVATLSECSVDPEYRAAICDGGIIQYLSKFLESENQVRLNLECGTRPREYFNVHIPFFDAYLSNSNDLINIHHTQ